MMLVHQNTVESYLEDTILHSLQQTADEQVNKYIHTYNNCNIRTYIIFLIVTLNVYCMLVGKR